VPGIKQILPYLKTTLKLIQMSFKQNADLFIQDCNSGEIFCVSRGEAENIAQESEENFENLSDYFLDLNLRGNKVARLFFVLQNPHDHFTSKMENRFSRMAKYLEVLLEDLLIDRMLIEDTKQSNQYMNNLIDSAYPGLLATDSQGIVTFFNKAAEKITGYDKSEVIGERILNLFSGSDFLTVLHRGESFYNRELVSRSPKGQVRVLVTCQPIKDGGDIKGVVANLKSPVELKKLLDNYFVSEEEPPKQLIGQSPAFNNVWEKACQVAGSSSSVLIQGESGTGKELFARAIHNKSMRRENNFIIINCAAIPEKLLESELFGYEAGAFTGAKPGGKPGKFELAHNGTIFLDEIGDMPLGLQSKILKVIQDRSFFRIGGTEEIAVDVRIISATNQDLEDLIKQKKFRKDLYYRLNVIPLYLPPLRERKQDIITLAEHFIEKYNQELHMNILGLTKAAAEALVNYHFPGNIRELENIIEYAINMEEEDYIQEKNLNFTRNSSLKDTRVDLTKDLAEAVEALEAKMIKESLKKWGYDTKGKLAAAQDLGISKTTLYNKINKYNIK